MRCLACDKRLGPQEACRKYLFLPDTFIEMCNQCTDDAGIIRTDQGEEVAQQTVDMENEGGLPDPFDEVLGG